MILTLTGLTLLTMPGLTIQTYGHPTQLQVQPLTAYHGRLEVKQLNQPYSIDGNGNIYLTPSNVHYLIKQTKGK